MPLAFPTTQEITHIVRNRIVDPARFIGAAFCPVVNEYAEKIEYDVLEGSYGMTQAHAINADPKIIQLPVQSQKMFKTAYWKDSYRLNEEELLYTRRAGTYNQRAGRDRVLMRAKQMDDRVETRIEYLRWQPLVNGTLTVNENNVIFTIDYGIPATNKPVLAGTAKWDDVVNSDPITDISNWMILYRGTGAKPQRCVFNLKTAQKLLQNQKLRDLLKQSGFVESLQLGNMGKALKIFFPELEFNIYDEGYSTDGTNFNLFVPDGRFVMIGGVTSSAGNSELQGELMMDFASTISLHNGGIDNPQPGKFAIIEDKSSQEKNPYVDVTVGVYGLPRVYHPNWIVSATVF